MTATSDGREILIALPQVLRQLVVLTQDSSIPVSIDAASALVNVTGDESGTEALLNISEFGSSKNNLENTQEHSSNLIEICIK